MLLNKLYITKNIAVTTSCLLLFGGCAAVLEQNAGKIGGTAVGAGAGAVIGKQLGGDAGLVIGALVGGGIGYLIGNEIDTRRENLAKLSKEEKIEVVSQNIVQNENQVLSQNSNEKVDSKNVIGDSFTVFSDEEQFALNSSNLSKKSEQVFGKIANEYNLCHIDRAGSPACGVTGEGTERSNPIEEEGMTRGPRDAPLCTKIDREMK